MTVATIMSVWVAAAVTVNDEADPRLARVTPQDISKAWLQSEPWDGLPTMMLAVGLVCCGLAVLLALRGWRRCRQCPPDWMLFWVLAGEIGLSWRDRWLLWRVSRRGGLGSPLALMLSAGTLDHHLRANATALGPAAQALLQSRGERMRSLLYHEPVESHRM